MTSLTNLVARHRLLFSVMATIVCLVVLVLGLRLAVIYTVPMFYGDYVSAAQSEVASPANAWYDAGLAAYKQKDYDQAKEYLSKSYSALSAEDGQIKPSDNHIAGEIQFLLALTHERTKQNFMAIEAYKQALRHNPDHMVAKYNLERLLSDRGGSGGAGEGEGDTSAPGGKAGKDGKKGI
ncbi:hypothetical protein BH11CYA1_BH11CYA1_44120 [soil metagenome]